ncbi:hypothetical protein [Paenibacillus cineris]|uniref:Uncharacterized protein n=1 Tax=Paenibacillus cineris TaxID=237530 RepID=A0ABQ4LN68_9BACL|nr:hypothetical protein [Paenibacillus cineris]GIO57961.1 hypothetical protein J21TS7_62790 [Paenibacillus cineris]
MKKGHPFMLQIPMLRTADIKVGRVFQSEGIPHFKVHSIASIEIDGTKATIIGFAAKEERKDD